MRLALWIFLILYPSFAFAEEISCPLDLDVAPQKLAKTPPGWRTFVDAYHARYVLEGITLYNGKPEELASLVADTDTADYSGWVLHDNGHEHYYLACRYADTALQLTRELPSSMKRCRIDYEKDITINGLPSPQKVSCR